MSSEKIANFKGKSDEKRSFDNMKKVIVKVLGFILTACFAVFFYVTFLFAIVPAINDAALVTLMARTTSEKMLEILMVYYPGFICIDGLICYLIFKLIKIVYGFINRLLEKAFKGKSETVKNE